MSDLSRVTKLLASGDEEAALDALLAAWQETRALEIADLIETLSTRLARHVPKPAGSLEPFQVRWLAMARRRRAVDLPVLLESIFWTTQRSGNAIVEGLAKRGAALAGWPADPRFGRLFAGQVRSSMFGAMSKGHQPFWRDIFAQVLVHDDPRSIDAFAGISLKKMFRGWNDVAQRIAFFDERIAEILGALRAKHPKGAPALPKALAKDVRAVRDAIAGLPKPSEALIARLAEAPPEGPRVAAPTRGPEKVRDPGDALRAALGARGDDDAILTALLDAWRATRSPRIGDLIDTISKRLAPRVETLGGVKRAEIQKAWLTRAAAGRGRDLPMLYGTITRTERRATDALERVKAIATWPRDPRAALGVVGALEEITFYASSTRPFWTALIASAIPNGDIRAATALEELASRLDRILTLEYTDLASTRRWYDGRIREAATAIRAEVERLPPLSDDHAALCDRIEAQIQTEDDPSARLLAAVYRDPADDGVRQVYADHLLERDDPRGEFITLQMAPARDLAREEELLERHIDRWLGPLASMVLEERIQFARGFVTDVWLAEPRDRDAFDRVIGDPIWSTVERLHLASEQSIANGLLAHDVMRGITHLGAYEPDPLLALLEKGTLPYASLGLGGFTTPRLQRELLRGAGRLTNVRAIELDGRDGDEARTYTALFHSPMGQRLERVTVLERCVGFDAWLTAVEKLPRATFALRSYRRGGGELSITRDAKKRLTIAHATVGPEITYARVADLLAPNARFTFELRITGRPPTKAEKARLLRSGIVI